MNLRFLRFVVALCLLLFIVPLATANGAGLKGKLSGGVHTASVNTAANRSVLPKKGDIAVVGSSLSSPDTVNIVSLFEQELCEV